MTPTHDEPKSDSPEVSASYSIERIGHGLRKTPPAAADMAYMLMGELLVNMWRGKDYLYEWATACEQEIVDTRAGLVTGEREEG